MPAQAVRDTSLSPAHVGGRGDAQPCLWERCISFRFLGGATHRLASGTWEKWLLSCNVDSTIRGQN